MPEHIFSLLCRNTIIDSRTNNLSIIEVIESIEISGEGPENYKKDDVVIFNFGFKIVTLWVRSDRIKPESFTFRITLLTPDNKRHPLQPINGDLTKSLRHRTFAEYENLLISGPGTYKFNVELGSGSVGRIRWRKVASIPLDIIFKIPIASKTKSKKARKKTKKKAKEKTTRKKKVK